MLANSALTLKATGDGIVQREGGRGLGLLARRAPFLRVDLVAGLLPLANLARPADGFVTVPAVQVTLAVVVVVVLDVLGLAAGPTDSRHSSTQIYAPRRGPPPGRTR
ncbi:MAG: hypothetical protein EOO77_14630 [Oxalobacteraceae bacterium]|nr:MAG: hypothetical protein EOO77_14630 [Oxalobacteraceae bacterium]